MYYYIKLRKKGTPSWKALRENGKIVVFDKFEIAKGQTTNSKDFEYKIISLTHHPTNKQSPIQGKKYLKMGW